MYILAHVELNPIHDNSKIIYVDVYACIYI